MRYFLNPRSTTALVGTAALATGALFAQSPISQSMGAQPSKADAGVRVQLHWGDFDADGLEDALAVEPSGSLALLRNAGSGSFEDVTLTAGLSTIEGARFAIWQDYDLDGLDDIFVGTASGESHLLRNIGALYEDVTKSSGITAFGADLAAQWLDYDGDGKPDLHLVQDGANVLYHATEDGRFEPIGLPNVAIAGTGSDVTNVMNGPVASAGGKSNTAADGTSPSASRGSGVRGNLAGGRTPATPGTSSGTAFGTAVNILRCVISMSDANGGGPCIRASRTPTLGMLYPLSQDLFVDEGTGRTGLGTTTPRRRLHVQQDSALPVLISGNNAPGLTLENTSAASLWSMFHDNSDSLIIRDTADSVNRMVIRGDSGNVGIGTDNPLSDLHVDGTLRSALGGNRALITGVVDSGDQTALQGISVSGASHSVGFYANGIGLNPGSGAATVFARSNGRFGIRTMSPIADFAIEDRIWMGRNPFGLDETAMMTHHADGLRAGYIGPLSSTVYTLGVHEENGVFISGGVLYDTVTQMSNVFATVKNFRETNPRDPETDIVYACVEGPEAAAYIRGTATLVNGYARVELPQHFADVATTPGMTVQTSPRSASSRGLAVVERTTTYIEVRELMQGQGNYEFDWEVKAVRKRFENYEVIRPKLRSPQMAQADEIEPVDR